MSVDRGFLGWICGRCKKVVSSPPLGRCHDCGGVYREAHPADLECSRCGVEDSSRLWDRREYDRLCDDCKAEVFGEEATR